MKWNANKANIIISLIVCLLYSKQLSIKIKKTMQHKTKKERARERTRQRLLFIFRIYLVVSCLFTNLTQ